MTFAALYSMGIGGANMKLGIISDTHDRIDRVHAALELLRHQGADRLIHCGDITRPETVSHFRGWQIDFVLGNCDWQPDELQAAIAAIGGTLHDQFGHLEIMNRAIAWIHSDNAALFQSLEYANHYDYLFYGHTHVAEQHRTGKTLVCNPGALHRVKWPSVMVLEVDSDQLVKIDVPNVASSDMTSLG